MSVPILALTKPEATAAADPLEDPPQTLFNFLSLGLTGVPKKLFVPQDPYANSTKLFFPIICDPALINLLTIVALAKLILFLKTSEPLVQIVPLR